MSEQMNRVAYALRREGVQIVRTVANEQGVMVYW